MRIFKNVCLILAFPWNFYLIQSLPLRQASPVSLCRHYPCFPLWESLLRCCQASAASRVARSAERGLFKTSPYVAASPCLHKILLTKFSSAKIVSLFHRLPLGGRLRREAVVRGATCFLSESFQSSGATCSPFPLLSPLGKVAAKPPIEVCLKFRLMLRPSLSFPFGLNFACCRSNPGKYGERRRADRAPPPCVFLKNRQSGGKKILAAALIFNRCFRYSGNR